LNNNLKKEMNQGVSDNWDFLKKVFKLILKKVDDEKELNL